MKRLLFPAFILVLCFSPLHAAEDEVLQPNDLTPGVALSQAITETTGIAVSPLLAVSTIGSWKYFTTEPEMRAELDWYCQPWAWVTGLVVLSLCFFKDSFGTAVPGPLKKPFDVAELMENKFSAILAGGTVIPLIMKEYTRAMGASPMEVPSAVIGMDFVAFIDASWITIPLAVIAFGIIWVCSNVVNVLIILSPFSTFDAILKIGRLALLACIGIAYAIAPWLGALFCGFIFLIACFIAPTAVRLSYFGTLMSLDVMMPWRAKKTAVPSQPKVFTISRIGRLPKRICGRVSRSDEGTLMLNYRRWFSTKAKSAEIPESRLLVAKGLIAPSIISVDENGKMRRMMLLLPRYRRREQEVSDALGLNGVREQIWKRGWSAIKDAWAQWRGRAISIDQA